LVDIFEKAARACGSTADRKKLDPLFGWASAVGQKANARVPEGMDRVCHSMTQNAHFLDFAKLCDEIGQVRNKLDHAGTGGNLSKPKRVKSKAAELLRRALDISTAF
jgi:hypothetical protein